MPYEFEHRNEIPLEKREANPILSRAGAWKEDSDHFFLKDNEHRFKKTLSEKFEGRHLIAARYANLSKPNAIHFEQGRSQCMSRKLCRRGCPFGGYFSSNSSTLPWAEKTGNLTLRPFSVVHSLIYDEKKGKATGGCVIDSNTKKSIEYYAKIVFVNASAYNSNLILLNPELGGWGVSAHMMGETIPKESNSVSVHPTRNPSLTYMALTARAANHAVEEMRKGNV